MTTLPSLERLIVRPRLLRKGKREYELFLSKDNQHRFYDYVGHYTKERFTIGPLMSEDGVMISDPKFQVALLNQHFSPKFLLDSEDPQEPLKVFHE